MQELLANFLLMLLVSCASMAHAGRLSLHVQAGSDDEITVTVEGDGDLEKIAMGLVDRMLEERARANGSNELTSPLAEPDAPEGQLDYEWLRSRLGMCAYDYERATVIAYAAQRAGLRSSSRSVAETIYRELDERRQPAWRATFSGARENGLVKQAVHGVWVPTEAGAHFVRTGLRHTPAAQGGGETDG